jgi:hypothetical protein
VISTLLEADVTDESIRELTPDEARTLAGSLTSGSDR